MFSQVAVITGLKGMPALGTSDEALHAIPMKKEKGMPGKENARNAKLSVNWQLEDS